MLKDNAMKYFEQEYDDLKKAIDKNPTLRTELILESMSRCYGVTIFIREYYRDVVSTGEIISAFNVLNAKFSALLAKKK